jgi:hypothetical protein
VDKLVVDELAARIKVPRVSLVFSEQAHNVAYWHFASIRHHALNGRFWSNSGHWSAPALNASVAFDPERSSGAAQRHSAGAAYMFNKCAVISVQ